MKVFLCGWKLSFPLGVFYFGGVWKIGFYSDIFFRESIWNSSGNFSQRSRLCVTDFPSKNPNDFLINPIEFYTKSPQKHHQNPTISILFAPSISDIRKSLFGKPIYRLNKIQIAIFFLQLYNPKKQQKL